MSIEREIKLSADAGVVLPDLTDAKRHITVGPRSILQLDATYYDTPALSLARWGVTLRSRTGEPGHMWTLKLPVSVDDSELSRHELTFDGPSGHIPASVRLAVRGFVRASEPRAGRSVEHRANHLRSSSRRRALGDDL